MRMISSDACDSVAGGWGVPGAVGGAIVGGLSYIGSAVGSGTFTGGGFATAVGVGAVAGALMGPPGIKAAAGQTAVGGYLGFIGGTVQGAADRGGSGAAGASSFAGGGIELLMRNPNLDPPTPLGL